MNKSKEKNTVIWTEKNVLHVAGEMFLGSSVLYSCKWSLRFCVHLLLAWESVNESHAYYFPNSSHKPLIFCCFFFCFVFNFPASVSI